MTDAKIKSVKVELENGNVLEFNKQVLLFAMDEMTDTEKKISGASGKICAVVNCKPDFLATCVESALGTLRDQCPGLDSMVMLQHMGTP